MLETVKKACFILVAIPAIVLLFLCDVALNSDAYNANKD